jgi:hypothetical protein|tara:strand:- start:502 stop:729 length:228 start_codon:yes stop_codon:yes gene_type:complete
MVRELLSEHRGVEDYDNRSASIYYVNRTHYEVEFYKDKYLIETRVMKTEEGDAITFHSEHYADNAAENYCLGYMP